MAEQLTVSEGADLPEVESLARELASAYTTRIQWYRRTYGEQWAEAFTDRQAASIDFQRRALTDPPDQVTFSALNDLVEIDPEGTQLAWARVKQAARDELTSGYRAARVMEFDGDAWQRAQFLAILVAFRDEWQPANAGEGLLVDMLAQTYASYLDWLRQLQIYITNGASSGSTIMILAKLTTMRVSEIFLPWPSRVSSS